MVTTPNLFQSYTFIGNKSVKQCQVNMKIGFKVKNKFLPEIIETWSL